MMTMKIDEAVDLGSPVTLMRKTVHQRLKKKLELKKTKRNFRGFGNKIAGCEGIVETEFIIDGDEYDVNYYVVKQSGHGM